MKILIFFIMLSATSVFGQQTEGLKTQKTTKNSILERKLPEKSQDSLARSNFKSILKKDNSSSVFGTANPYNSEVQMNVNRLQNNVNTFNNNTFNRMIPQGREYNLTKENNYIQN